MLSPIRKMLGKVRRRRVHQNRTTQEELGRHALEALGFDQGCLQASFRRSCGQVVVTASVGKRPMGKATRKFDRL